MLKKIILTFIVSTGLGSAYADIKCPDNDGVFYVPVSGGIIRFVMPDGAVDDPQAPYAAPKNFNSWAIEKKITRDDITSYDPVSTHQFGYGVVCNYNVHWRSGNVPISIYYCDGKQCPV